MQLRVIYRQLQAPQHHWCDGKEKKYLDRKSPDISPHTGKGSCFPMIPRTSHGEYQPELCFKVNFSCWGSKLDDGFYGKGGNGWYDSKYFSYRPHLDYSHPRLCSSKQIAEIKPMILWLNCNFKLKVEPEVRPFPYRYPPACEIRVRDSFRLNIGTRAEDIETYYILSETA